MLLEQKISNRKNVTLLNITKLSTLIYLLNYLILDLYLVLLLNPFLSNFICK